MSDQELAEIEQMAEYHLKCFDHWYEKAVLADQAAREHLSQARAFIARHEELLQMKETGALHA